LSTTGTRRGQGNRWGGRNLILKKIFIFSVLIIFLSQISAFGSSSEMPANNELRTIKSKNGEYTITDQVNGMGGGNDLVFLKKSKKVLTVEDVTGTVWVDDNRLAYSVSPIYSDYPGVFLFDCQTGKAVTLVSPKHLDKSYQSFTDYFELKSYSPKEGGVIYFYYVPDVDSEFDVSDFPKSNKYLYEVSILGGKVKKVH
jgi:hypothetical protein